MSVSNFQVVILRRSPELAEGTSCNIVELKRRLRGSSTKNQVLTHPGRGALPSASSQALLQEILQLRLRMTTEDNDANSMNNAGEVVPYTCLATVVIFVH